MSEEGCTRLRVFSVSRNITLYISGTVGVFLLYLFQSIHIHIYIFFFFDKNFNNRYFITLEITFMHTVDIEDNKYYLNNIMEKVIPKSKTKFLQNLDIYMFVCMLLVTHCF